jgi:Fe-S-cluster containining protein
MQPNNTHNDQAIMDDITIAPVDPSSTVTQNPPPGDLCNQCGKCCRMATPGGINHAQLQVMAQAGNPSAQAFLSVFVPYASHEEARQAMPDHVDRMQAAMADKPEAWEALSFYYCKHLQPNNHCGIYETRPVFCQLTPRNGWMVMPPGCGYEGWQFAQREQQKHDIRLLKAQLQFFEALSPDGIHHPLYPEQTLTQIREAVAQRIAPLVKYGADHW